MKTKPFQPKLATAIVVLALLLGWHGLLPAQQNQESSVDIVVKINKLEETLNVVDELMATSSGQPALSPTAMLKGMLQGTDWIDPGRSIVIGVELIQGQPKATLLIPFQSPNQNFQAAYGAVSGPDYYVMTLPPGQQPVISDATEAALVASCRSKAKDFLSVEMAAGKLLTKANQQITETLNKLEALPQSQDAPQFGPTPEELRRTVVSLLDAARQLETLTLGLDISQQVFTYSFGATALPDTTLAGLFSQGGNTSLLDDFKPMHQMTFRCRSFDVEKMIGLIDDSFGKFYESMGLDFSAVATIAKSFTGETVGGMSYAGDIMSIQTVNVLKDSIDASGFLEKAYVPWMMKYSQDVAKMVEEQTGTSIESPFVRTQDSTVSGYKVIGIKAQFPLLTGLQFPKTDAASGLMRFEMRLTTVGNLLLTADNDKRMAELIEIAKGVKERPAKGPLMTGDMDLGGYLGFIADTIPGMAGKDQILSKLGKVTFAFDLKDGRADSRFSVRMDDIKAMVAAFSKGAGAFAPSAPGFEEEEAAITEETAEPEKPAREEQQSKPKEEDPQYWYGKGALCAIYGNDEAAIDYYKKAIELDPQSSEVHFQQGISYGEIGKYEEAISAINEAFDMGPRKGLYLYGRGRVYLLSGDKTRATEDFNEAAALGNRDAQEYLQDTLQARHRVVSHP